MIEIAYEALVPIDIELNVNTEKIPTDIELNVNAEKIIITFFPEANELWLRPSKSDRTYRFVVDMCFINKELNNFLEETYNLYPYTSQFRNNAKTVLLRAVNIVINAKEYENGRI